MTVNTLKATQKKWKGLCELICNKIIIDDLLGKGNADNDPGFLEDQIHLDGLNQETIYNSHLMKASSFFQKMGGLMNILPNNLFTIKEQRQLVKIKGNPSDIKRTRKLVKELKKNGLSCQLKLEYNINRNLLANKLSIIEKDAILKVFAYDKYPNYYGHSLLIKKTGENEFIFFDPNDGETRNLTVGEIAKKIETALASFGENLYITRAEDFLAKLIQKNVI